MNRYFFDLASADTNYYDYHGRELRSVNDARDIAEVMALDLGCSETCSWVGSNITVRDTLGATILSVPIRPMPDLSVAA